MSEMSFGLWLSADALGTFADEADLTLVWMAIVSSSSPRLTSG